MTVIPAHAIPTPDALAAAGSFLLRPVQFIFSLILFPLYWTYLRFRIYSVINRRGILIFFSGIVFFLAIHAINNSDREKENNPFQIDEHVIHWSEVLSEDHLDNTMIVDVRGRISLKKYDIIPSVKANYDNWDSLLSSSSLLQKLESIDSLSKLRILITCEAGTYRTEKAFKKLMTTIYNNGLDDRIEVLTIRNGLMFLSSEFSDPHQGMVRFVRSNVANLWCTSGLIDLSGMQKSLTSKTTIDPLNKTDWTIINHSSFDSLSSIELSSFPHPFLVSDIDYVYIENDRMKVYPDRIMAWILKFNFLTVFLTLLLIETLLLAYFRYNSLKFEIGDFLLAPKRAYIYKQSYLYTPIIFTFSIQVLAGYFPDYHNLSFFDSMYVTGLWKGDFGGLFLLSGALVGVAIILAFSNSIPLRTSAIKKLLDHNLVNPRCFHFRFKPGIYILVIVPFIAANQYIRLPSLFHFLMIVPIYLSIDTILSLIVHRNVRTSDGKRQFFAGVFGVNGSSNPKYELHTSSIISPGTFLVKDLKRSAEYKVGRFSSTIISDNLESHLDPVALNKLTLLSNWFTTHLDETAILELSEKMQISGIRSHTLQSQNEGFDISRKLSQLCTDQSLDQDNILLTSIDSLDHKERVLPIATSLINGRWGKDKGAGKARRKWIFIPFKNTSEEIFFHFGGKLYQRNILNENAGIIPWNWLYEYYLELYARFPGVLIQIWGRTYDPKYDKWIRKCQTLNTKDKREKSYKYLRRATLFLTQEGAEIQEIVVLTHTKALELWSINKTDVHIDAAVQQLDYLRRVIAERFQKLYDILTTKLAEILEIAHDGEQLKYSSITWLVQNKNLFKWENAIHNSWKDNKLLYDQFAKFSLSNTVTVGELESQQINGSRQAKASPSNPEIWVSRINEPIIGVCHFFNDAVAAPRTSINQQIFFLEHLVPTDVAKFGEAQGIVSKFGSLLSHASILCREHNIPHLIHPNWPSEVSQNAFIRLDHDCDIQILEPGSNPGVHWLESVDPSLLNQKASRLSTLIQNNFLVLPGLVLDQVALNNGYVLFDSTQVTICNFINSLFKAQSKIIVRSAAQDEDLKEFSNAGLYKSLVSLNNVNEIQEKLGLVAESMNSVERPKEKYNAQVLIQPYLETQFGGVLFTSGHNLGYGSQMVIEASSSGADQVVKGFVDSRYTIQRSDKPFSYARKKGSLQLPESLLTKLFRIGLDLEALFGSPQDIEWGFDNEDLYIFQTRDITV